MKKKVFTALQVLGNAAGIVSGAVAMQYSSEIKGMGTGSGASYETYGGVLIPAFKMHLRRYHIMYVT